MAGGGGGRFKEMIMRGQVIPYEMKRSRRVIDWEWMRFKVIAESIEIRVLGTVAAGEPIEARRFWIFACNRPIPK